VAIVDEIRPPRRATHEIPRNHDAIELGLLNWKIVQHRHHQINNIFHFKRVDNGNSVHVFNADHYLMAEYYSRTGRVSWHRMVAASQRESVEKWLKENYPMTRPATIIPGIQPTKKKLKK